MSETSVCWRCGASLSALSMPLGRLDECPECEVQLHVCRMCVYFAPGVPKSCREDDAEEVRDKDRANFCDYFEPAADAYDSSFSKADQKAGAQLDQLFGDGQGTTAPDDPLGQTAEDLFKKD